jgi:hypothetical protein
MARVTLTPLIQTADQTALALSAATFTASGVAPGGTGAGNGVQFTNYGPGQTLLYVQLGSTASTLTVQIGSTLFNQGATGFTVGPLTASTVSMVGPFHSALDQQGTSQVAVDFSSVTNCLVIAVQLAGVY